jgi:hypothetical protein
MGGKIQYFCQGDLRFFAATQQSNRQGLYCRQWLEYARSGTMYAFPPSWVMTAVLGLL